MSVLTEVKEREKKSVEEKDANKKLEEEERLVESRPPSPDHGPPPVESLQANEGYELLTVRSYGTPPNERCPKLSHHNSTILK